MRDGSLIRVARGVYADPPPPGPPWDHARYRLLARAAALHRLRDGGHWFSHGTAAVLWGFSLAVIPTHVDITALVAPRESRVGGRSGVREHWTTRPERAAEVSAVPALPSSCPERTVLDCAASLPAAHALAIADSALRGGVDRKGIDRLLDAAVGARGVRRARTVLARADGGAESAGESMLRWTLLESGVADPVVQVPVETSIGWRWLDLGWPEAKVGIEFDGRVKYGSDGAQAVRVVLEEKRRQQAIEDEGWTLLRFDWSDLSHPDRIMARVTRALRTRSIRQPSELAEIGVSARDRYF